MEGLTWGGSGFGVRVSWSEYRRGQGRRSGPSQRKLGGSGLRQCIEIAEGGGFGGNVMEVLLLSPLLGFYWFEMLGSGKWGFHCLSTRAPVFNSFNFNPNLQLVQLQPRTQL